MLHHKARSGEGEHSGKLAEDPVSQVPSHWETFLLLQHGSTGGPNVKATSMPLFFWPLSSNGLTSVGPKKQNKFLQ